MDQGLTSMTNLWDLTDEQKLLRDSIREFAETEIREKAMELDARAEFSNELTLKMGEQGLFGMMIPTELGGSEVDYKTYIMAVEELARVDGSQAITVAAGNSLGINPLYYFGNEAQRKKYLPELCEGPKHLFGFGLTEPNAGSDAGGTQTTAYKDGNEWVLNGSKIFITNAGSELTKGSIIQAKMVNKDGSSLEGKPQYTCFIVDNDTPGYTVKTMHGKMLWKSSNTCELYLDDVRIPDENRLGEIGQGFKIMLATLDGGRLSIAAMGVGAAQGAYEIALKYAQEREQFGKPIIKFQNTAFNLADMAMDIEHARTFLYKTCWLADNKHPYQKEAAMTKLYCSEVACRVTDQAIQILGGYGLMDEYQVEKYWRDARLLRIGEGTSEIQRLVISRMIGC